MLDYKLDVAKLRESFAALNDATQKKIIFSAVSNGAKVIADQAKRNAETVPSGAAAGLRDTGVLIRNIARARIGRQGSRWIYHVGVRAGTSFQKKSGNDPWYWRLLELGYHRGKSFIRYQFMVPAYEQMKGAAVTKMGEVITRRVVREQKKFNKSQKQ